MSMGINTMNTVKTTKTMSDDARKQLPWLLLARAFIAMPSITHYTLKL